MKLQLITVRIIDHFHLHNKLELEIHLLSFSLSVPFPNTGRDIHAEVPAEIME